MKKRRTPGVYGLGHDQIDQLVQMVRVGFGDQISRPEFTDRMLALFEDIAGFETLPQRRRQQHLRTLWQSYESACRDPK
jgi:hypothetical protein